MFSKILLLNFVNLNSKLISSGKNTASINMKTFKKGNQYANEFSKKCRDLPIVKTHPKSCVPAKILKSILDGKRQLIGHTHISFSKGSRFVLSPGAPHVRAFQTTPKRSIPYSSVLLVLLRPLSKFVAALFGRSLRKWWLSLPPNKKKYFRNYLKQNKYLISVLSTILAGSSYYYYDSHVIEDEITKRRRFIAFNHNQMMQIAQVELDVELEVYKNRILPVSHPTYQQVFNVTNRLLQANKHYPSIQEKEWSITIIDDPDVKNAFVLPNGNIFIFTGMLNICSNNDQLGVILAHEIAHALLSHMAEQLSNVHLKEILLLIPVVIIWAVLPDGVAFLSHWLSNHFAKLLIHLPFSRQLETEADEVGLKLAARACFDVREASTFWGKMRYLSTVQNEEETVEFLSTHPSHETRQTFLDELIPNAIMLREKCECVPLPALDPRAFMRTLLDKVGKDAEDTVLLPHTRPKPMKT